MLLRYDVSGVPADRIQRILEVDWMHLIRNQCILDSPNYLREKGMPVIGLWGFGFHNAGHSPDLIRSIIQFFRKTTPKGAYIFGGAPSCWRLSEGDADHNTGLVDVWLNEFDAVSPWTIGRYKSDREADDFANTKMKGDVELIKRQSDATGRKVDYIPVVFPGGSVSLSISMFAGGSRAYRLFFRVLTCQKGSGVSMTSNAKVADFCGNKYSTPNDSVFEQSMGQCGMSMRSIPPYIEGTVLSILTDTTRVLHSCRSLKINATFRSRIGFGFWHSMRMDTMFRPTGEFYIFRMHVPRSF